MFLIAVTWNHFHCTQGITRQTQTNISWILLLWSFLRNSTDLQMMLHILPKIKIKSKVLFGKGRKQERHIPIQHKDKDCVHCQQLDSVLQFFLLNSHLSSRIAGKQLLASEVISVIKANWPHFFFFFFKKAFLFHSRKQTGVRLCLTYTLQSSTVILNPIKEWLAHAQ